MIGPDPAAVERGRERLVAALARQQLDPEHVAALVEVLSTITLADDMVRAGTSSLPHLAGALIAVVDAYRAALAEIGDTP